MTNLPTVNFDKYQLRTIKISDIKAYYDIGKDDENVYFLTWTAFKSLKEAEESLQVYLMRKYFNEPVGYAICEHDKMIGIIEFHTFSDFNKTAEVGYLLHKDYWNKGIMTSALEKLVYIGFTFLDLHHIKIRSIKENIGSRRVIEKNDFKLISIKKDEHYHEKTKSYHDVFTYILERNDFYGKQTKGDL